MVADPLAVWTQSGWEGAWPPPGSHERAVLDRLYWGDDHLRDEACPEGAYRPPFFYNGSGSGYLFGYKEDESLTRAHTFASAWCRYQALAGDDLASRRARGHLEERDLPLGTILWQIKTHPVGYGLEYLRAAARDRWGTPETRPVVDALLQNPAFRRALEDAGHRVLLRDGRLRRS